MNIYVHVMLLSLNNIFCNTIRIKNISNCTLFRLLNQLAFSMLITARYFDNQKYTEFCYIYFFHFRMTEIPAYLLKRPRRLLQADHSTELSLANESSAGGSTEDGDFKRLRKIREVTETRINEKKIH